MKPILPGAPWLIAHKSMLGINKPNQISLNGRDYVLWQNKKGEVFALDNICPHMQAPLSEGWICKDRNTIACPFHALEFDGEGKLYKEGQAGSKPVAQPLELIAIGDYIWTYGGFTPKLPIPDLISKIADKFEFIGVAGETSIQGNFSSNLLINYDFNHQNGSHRDLFKIASNKVTSFEQNGYYPKVTQESRRDRNTLADIIQNPALLAMPKVLVSQLEYSFPSTIAFFAETPVFKDTHIHIIYPESESRTKTFALCFAEFKHPIFKLLMKKMLLKAVATVVKQDVTTIESLYPKQNTKIKLPNEEVMLYAEKLYRDWPNLDETCGKGVEEREGSAAF